MLSQTWSLLKASFNEWQADNAPRLGAALAYYTVLSLAPLLVLLLAALSFFFSRAAAQTDLLKQIAMVMGPSAAQTINGVVQSAWPTGAGAFTGILSVAALLFAASGMFAELRASLDAIWHIMPPTEGGLIALIKGRLKAVLMVIAVGVLLLLSLLAATAVTVLSDFIQFSTPPLVLQAANFVISFAMITLLFALIYKFVPDRYIAWKDVWVGAAMTSLLFTVGKTLIGIYLAKSNPGSAYGAAGSLVILLIWIYYSAQVFFFGAEFTQVFANQREAHANGRQRAA
jgi:membrane protein